MTPRDPTSPLELVFHDDGFDVHRAGLCTAEVRWDLLREVAAWRHDPGGEDILTLGFRISNDAKYIEIDEQTPQYAELLEALYAALPDIPRDWWVDIAQGLGANKTTLHGLPPSREPHRLAERSMLLRARREKRDSKQARRRAVVLAGAVAVAALLQALLSAALTGVSPVLACAAGPLLLVAVVARLYPQPRAFFAMLVGFHVAEVLWHAAGIGGVSLIGQLLDGKGAYLLQLGGEILLGFVVMLLPDRRVGQLRRR